MNKAEIIREFFAEAGSTIISVEFEKKNGQLRKIQFNPKDRNEIKGFGAPNQDENIIRIRDFSLAQKNIPAWRSFDVRRIRKITSRGQVFEF